MKHLKYLIFVFAILMCSGCYNYREINKLAITSAVGIDKGEMVLKLLFKL